jgi:hypothetical protein
VLLREESGEKNGKKITLFETVFVENKKYIFRLIYFIFFEQAINIFYY